jgi:hypothetical protein
MQFEVSKLRELQSHRGMISLQQLQSATEEELSALLSLLFIFSTACLTHVLMCKLTFYMDL